MKNRTQAGDQPRQPPIPGQSLSDSPTDHLIAEVIGDLAEEVRATCTLLDMFSHRLVKELAIAETQETDALVLGCYTLGRRQCEALNDKLIAAMEWAYSMQFEKEGRSI